MNDPVTRWPEIQTLFEQALDRPPDERTAWLRSVCGDDLEVYREVEALLEGDRDQHTVFAGSALDLLAPADLEDALVPSKTGERVGPWVLGERIGAGGMGAVYRAQRADGFEQTAALKRIKPGMDSEAVLARFRAERQILARLEHPGIARLLDGGLAGDGRPYFAMELVEGEPITDYCDGLGLEVDERLRLFVEVCDAVAYAHRQLVVHRDLKPSNVLVTDLEDGTRQVKLLDFGIARVLSDDHGDGLTRTGQRVLTPSYAAPEQHRGESPSTATDAYALGVLLYRLLTGTLPTEDKGELAALSTSVPTEPSRPSTRVQDAATRRDLEGDLDTIILKALRLEPERRYGSAAELGADVRRYLEDVPIEARPATAGYRARLFVR
ncbi:serine/threonine-protein kinase, partial [Rubrivirga sp.]|uniref:serine/threonine-protein kinase n=1 Tax=Rubrivirga sp. TaxID=1885344 RepID=UPI003C790954